MPVDLVLDNPLKDFVESRNPMEVTDSHKTVFLNARYRYGKVHGVDTWCNAYAQLLKINNPQIEVLEVKLETTVYDSNIELDRWWA
jgi:hypothetical protein